MPRQTLKVSSQLGEDEEVDELLLICGVDARAITATSFANYDKGNQFISAFSRFLGRGIFVSDGQQWKTHRAMTRPFFAKDKMGGGDDIHILFEPYVNKLIANLERSTGEPMDVQEAFSRYTMDVAGRFLFGSELHCLDQTEPAPFATSFAAGQDVSHLISDQVLR